MRMIAIVLCALMLLLPIVAQAEELPLRDFSEVKDWFTSNPRNVKDIGDPFVLQEESGYFMFATGGSIGFNVWLIPSLGVTGSACATLFAYVVYFVPLLTFLWRKLHITLFSRKQLWVLLLTAALFGLNALWQWLLSPLFARLGSGLSVVLLQALVRTLFFLAVAYAAVRRMHVSTDVDNILRFKK